MTFTEVADYYESRPELALYTLTTELTRMEYTVINQGGQTLRDPLAIRRCYDEASGGGSVGGPGESCELLWRMANQSLLEFLLRPLHGHWLRAEMESSVSVASCKLEIDLRKRSLSTSCALVVACEHDGERLEVATSAGSICVDLRHATLAMSLAQPTLLVDDAGRTIAQHATKA